ncbi:hypothetical protein C8Q80DRAFT_820305 [Daedaleopsis nitida]|nr:hypothetical protein C8Q80DRAFT_820305 [Daedaleopsis nitida]
MLITQVLTFESLWSLSPLEVKIANLWPRRGFLNMAMSAMPLRCRGALPQLIRPRTHHRSDIAALSLTSTTTSYLLAIVSNVLELADGHIASTNSRNHHRPYFLEGRMRAWLGSALIGGRRASATEWRARRSPRPQPTSSSCSLHPPLSTARHRCVAEALIIHLLLTPASPSNPNPPPALVAAGDTVTISSAGDHSTPKTYRTPARRALENTCVGVEQARLGQLI